MEIDRLPASVATLFAELLEQALARERTAGVEASLPGGLVTKAIRGRRYDEMVARLNGSFVVTK